jgi:hypothetical protein
MEGGMVFYQVSSFLLYSVHAVTEIHMRLSEFEEICKRLCEFEEI